MNMITKNLLVEKLVTQSQICLSHWSLSSLIRLLLLFSTNLEWKTRKKSGIKGKKRIESNHYLVKRREMKVIIQILAQKTCKDSWKLHLQVILIWKQERKRLLRSFTRGTSYSQITKYVKLQTIMLGTSLIILKTLIIKEKLSALWILMMILMMRPKMAIWPSRDTGMNSSRRKEWMKTRLSLTLTFSATLSQRDSLIKMIHDLFAK